MSHYYENTPRGPVLPVFHTSSFNVTPLSRPLSWADVLEKLPVLSNQFYTKLLRSRPLMMAVRSIARLINTTLSPDMLLSLGFEPDWARNHVKSLSGAASCTDHKKILPAEICILMQKLSFLTLVKTSTHIYTLSKDKKHDPPSFDMGGLHFALTRYSLDAMSQVFGTNLLPLISPSDGDLLYRCFLQCHVVGNPGDAMGVGSAHLPLNITLQRARSGPFAVLTKRMRDTFSQYLNRCPTCIRTLDKGRPYVHAAEDPRLLRILPDECLIFSAISMDLFHDIYVMSHGRARGKPTYPISILVAVCLVSNSTAFILMENSKATSVGQALDMLKLRYRMPTVIICDKDSSFQSLAKNKNLMEDLSCRGIEFTVLPARHQFSNNCERQIQEAKKILNSLRQAPDKTIFHQPQSLLELQGKLLLTETVLSLKPTLISSRSQEELVIFPRMFMHPWMSASVVATTIQDILAGVFDASRTLSQLGKLNSYGREALRNALISYLQDSAVRFKTLRAGSRQSTPKELLYPMIGDVVLYKNSDTPPQTRYGLIKEVLKKNQVVVKTQLFGKPADLKMHISTISLLFRPAEWQHSLPVMPQPQDSPADIRSKEFCDMEIEIVQ